MYRVRLGQQEFTVIHEGRVNDGQRNILRFISKALSVMAMGCYVFVTLNNYFTLSVHLSYFSTLVCFFVRL